MNYFRIISFVVFGFIVSLSAAAQGVTIEGMGKGIKFTSQDGTFAAKMGFRFQTLYIGELNSTSNSYEDKMLIRRSRLKFDGFAFKPNLKYKVELALSNRDTRSGQIDESGDTPNIILDAVMMWEFSDGWSLWWGQTKLPGNRERVISSQKLQFVDRSLVNARFNLDRDKGIQLHHKSDDGKFKQALAISMGEGRNIIENNPGKGYQLTGRLEFLPMGSFTGKGDYFGSDLERESSPKLSIGLTGDLNNNATRVRGNLGGFNTDVDGNYLTNDLKSVFVDMMFKYDGFSAMSEFASRSTSNTNNGFGTGTGFVAQAGYLFPSNWEIAARYTDINRSAASALKDQTEYTLGVSRYIIGHSLKIQSDISYQELAGDKLYIFRVQTELAF